MDLAESAAASEALAFSKGWGADSQAESTQVSTVSDSQASVAGESNSQPAETQAASSVETSSASSVSGTESASEPVSQASSVVTSAASSAAIAVQTAAGSAPDDGKYKQRWLSQQGTVKAKDQRISALESQNASLAASHAGAAPSAAGSASQSVLDKIDALESKYIELIEEGKKNEAIALRKEIRALERETVIASATREATTAAHATVTAQTEQERLSAVVETAYKTQPYLDNKSDKADIDAILYVQAKRDYYTAEGHSLPDALQMAIEDAAERFGTVSAAGSSVQASQVGSAPASVPGSQEELKNMAAVKNKQTPVKTSQKPKGSGSFEDGWKSA